MESIPEDHQLTVTKEKDSLIGNQENRHKVEIPYSAASGKEQMGFNHSNGKQMKRMKKGIYISYSPEANFQERAFINDLVRQLKENNFAEDIWYDKDENCINSPTWFSLRMEAIERCQAALVVLSDSYFSCPVSVYEIRTLIERKTSDACSVEIFLVKFTNLSEAAISSFPSDVLANAVDLTSPLHQKLSVAEKTSAVLGQIMEQIETYAVINLPLASSNELEPKFDGEYKTKVIKN